MPVVTLTSDLAGSGYYLAALKGSILKAFGDVQLVDITNQITSFDLKGASFTVQKAYPYFPDGSIHVVHINSADAKNRLLLAEHNKHFFLVFDNGSGPLIFEHEPVTYFEVELQPESGSLFIKTILKGIETILHNLPKGNVAMQYKVLRRLQPSGSSGSIKGNILFIDPFGNAITNITEDFFKQHIKEDFVISIGGANIDTVSPYYNVNEPGYAVAFFNSEHLLEIAQNNSRGAQLFSLKVDGAVMIYEK